MADASNTKNTGRKNQKESQFSPPDDVLCRMFSYLDPVDLARCCLVCSYWNDIISNVSQSSSVVWKDVCDRQLRLLKNTNAYTQSILNTPVGTHGSQVASSSGSVEEEEEDDWKSLAVDFEQRRRFLGGLLSVQTLRGHTGRVTSCSVQGSLIVSGSADQTVCLWNAGTARCRTTLRVPSSSSVQSVASNDAMILAAAGAEVCIWNRSTWRLLRKIGGHYQQIRAMRLEDTEVMIGCNDGSVRIFDLYSSSCSQIFRLHSNHVTCLTASGSLRLLASGGGDGFIHVYHMGSCQPVARLLSGNPMEGAESIHLANDGYSLTSGTKAGYLYRWDLRAWKQPLCKLRLYTNTLSSLDSAAYAPSVLVTAGVNGTIHILDGDKCKPVRSFVRPKQTTASRDRIQAVTPTVPALDFLHNSRKQSGASLLSRGGVGSGPSPSDAVLAVRTGMTSVVAGHADGTLSLWRFGL